MPLHKNQSIRLSIDALSSDGAGVGRHEGFVVFVPHAALGDVLQVKLLKIAKTHAFAKIEQVVTPGKGRITPDCPASGSCGGCSFRHLAYDAELEAKQGFVEDALRRIGHLDTEVLPILPSPETSRYRNKVQYPVCALPNGKLGYGFFAHHSHRVVPCADCLLQPEMLNYIAERTVALLCELGATAYNEATGKGLVRHICLRQGEGSGDILLCIVLSNGALPHKDILTARLMTEFPAIKSVVLNINPHKTNVIFGKQSITQAGAGSIDSTLAGVPQRLGPLSFSQVNPKGAARLFNVAKDFAALAGKEHLLDLYCGSGVIGLSMAQHCQSLTGVEIHPESVESAKASAAQLGLAHTRFICADAGAAAGQLVAEGYRPDVITLDPPRKGCDAATLEAVYKLSPGRVVMVSCNPSTLARDVSILVTQYGYTLNQVQPVDMFPRTRHVECVVQLSQSNP